MLRFFTCTFLAFATLVPATNTLAADIIWDGGDGGWSADVGKWSGGQLAIDVFGRWDGWSAGSGEIANDVIIDNGAVTFDSDIDGDFRFTNQMASDGGTLTISDGASFTINTSDGDVDGQWTQFNTTALNLDGGTFRRTFGSPAEAAGIFSFGGIRGRDDMDININLTNGGRIENNSPTTFGWYLSDSANRKVTMTIDDGHLDLTGGDNWDYLGGAAGGAGNGDLQFHMTWDVDNDAPNNDQYAVNFTGPGSITVDRSGILVVVQTGPTEADFDFTTVTTPRSYQELWGLGILQADGVSGPDGASFDQYFSVSGEPGMDDYTLTRRESTNVDFTGDGVVDCADVDALVADIVASTNNPAFDLNGDTVVDQFDLEQWLADAATANGLASPYLPGDANLDGSVDVPDFNVWNSNKFTNAPGWCAADFNADGSVDVPDFNLWNGNKFTSSDANVVPEPAYLGWMAMFVAAVCLLRRRPAHRQH
ncbi:MAG: hypothetical protein AAF497_10060 [Planctomycetota bacterium]